MLVKEKLRQLRQLNATETMKKMAESNEGKIQCKNKWGYDRVKERKYAWYARCQQINGYLKIAIFQPYNIEKGIYTPQYELFINYTGKEYIWRELDEKGNEKRWTKSLIENIHLKAHWSYEWSSRNMMWLNPEGSRTIKHLLQTREGGYEGIKEWQHKIRKEKATEKFNKKVAPWEEEMKHVPELPEAFEKWWKKEALENNYIFYEYTKTGVREGYCTYCEKNVHITKPRHNKESACTECGRRIIYKSIKKMPQRIRGMRYSFQIIQKFKNGFIVRHFTGSKEYTKDNYKNPKYWKCENMRSIYESGNYKEYIVYVWGNYEQRGMRWYLQGYRYPGYFGNKKIYTKNITALSRTILKNTALPEMIRHRKSLAVERYLINEQENPVIEQLVKTGLFEIAEDVVTEKKYINSEAGELSKKLKLDKGRLSRLRKMKKARISHLIWLQYEKNINTQYADEMIEYFAGNTLLPDSFTFLKGHMTYVQIYNYMKRQQSLTGERPSQIRVTWNDYINMASKLKMDINNEKVYKPKNLKEKHAGAIELLQKSGMEKQAKTIEKKFPKVNEVCRTLQKYEYKGKKYVITAPKNVLDIVREGTILQHCVHTCDYYFDRIQRKETYLLFLRRVETPDTPYYTIEAEPNGNIRQKRTTGDNQNKDVDEAKNFLREWQKEISKRLTQEDKTLAEKSEELRLKEYKELREKGNRVWHGRLAGQLLADVLEDDFMSAV